MSALPFKTLTQELIQGKTVLLRLDLDVPLRQDFGELSRAAQGKLVVADDFRLQAGMETLGFCLDYAKSVIIMGHIGRPQGEDPNLSVKPIVYWLERGYGHIELPTGKLHILENLRFEAGEDDCDPIFVKELASYGDVFINEAFAAHHQASSTTEIAKLLPHAAGFNFAKEVEILTKVREDPERPLVAIIGGAKIEDKLPAVLEISKIADWVLVGGKLIKEIEEDREKFGRLGTNVMVGKLTEDGEDIAEETVQSWGEIIRGAKMVLWNGPLGRVEEEKNGKSRKIAQIIIESGAKTVLGGGDTIAYLDKFGLLKNFWHISTGGGAMLKFLTEGTLPTIEALSA